MVTEDPVGVDSREALCRYRLLYIASICTIFDSLSTTTNIESFPLDDTGRSVIRSMDTDSHRLSGMSRGLSVPFGFERSALTR